MARLVPVGLPARLTDISRTRCLVMGVLNVTPDSFSDGGRYLDPEAAITHGLALHASGADLVDIGGESTRPGAQRVDAEVELGRVLPVVAGLAASGVPVSIDTMRADVARAAVAAGAVLVNDVSGGLGDASMLDSVAEMGVPVVLMHWRGPSADMNSRSRYDDVVAEVVGHLEGRIDAAAAAGVARDAVIIDPGLGFAKRDEHNWTLLRNLDRLADLDRPVLIGASRKRFLGQLLSDGASPRPGGERDDATDAITALVAARGAWAVRVHDVRGSVDAALVAARMGEDGVHDS